MLDVLRDLKASVRRRNMPADVRRYLRLCRQTGAVFIHIPKTGGKSMLRALYGLDTHEGPGHATAAFYAAALGPSTWKRGVKIAVMRDPWERAYSAYTFALAGGFKLPADDHRKAALHGVSFPEFVARLSEEDALRSDLLMRPQTSFLRLADGSLCDVELLRTESLAEDAARLAARRGLPIDPVPHANRSRPIDEDQRQSDREATIGIIRGVYAADYDLLRTRFGDPAAGA
ncbi:MAG: sulfotransferase family 2 domain-containing protein [Planctomycetota bacterium]